MSDLSENVRTVTVPSKTTVQTIAGANANRRQLFISNDSTGILYLLYGSNGAAVSSTNYSVQLPANPAGVASLVEDKFSGIITGLWSGANGFAYVCEVTD